MVIKWDHARRFFSKIKLSQKPVAGASGTTGHQTKRAFAVMFLTALFLLCVFMGGQSAYAASATWSATPLSGDWFNTANWSPNTVPQQSTDTASFALSTQTTVNNSSNLVFVSLNGITFNAGASAYTLTGVPGAAYLISGVGVTNNSGIMQNFVAPTGTGGEGMIDFSHSATAGILVTYTNNPGALGVSSRAMTRFFNTSTAGSATIVNNGGSFAGASGGATLFLDTSNAGTAAFTNNGMTVSTASGSGGISFQGSASAANGTFTNNGATAGTSSGGGAIGFFVNATAANGTFINNASTVVGSQEGNGGSIFFGNTSTASSGHFTNNGATVSGAGAGVTRFGDTATAENAIFTNNGGQASGGTGGLMVFEDNSTAGNAAITSNGGAVAGASFTEIVFGNSASAGNASITNNAGAANTAAGADTIFASSSTAFSATITNNGAAIAGAQAAFTQIRESASAGSATFINNGAHTNGGPGGFTEFGQLGTSGDTDSAGSATLIANGGINGGQGGRIFFYADSLGGTSRVELFGASSDPQSSPAYGALDISSHNAPGLTLGSIEGNGNIFLGAKKLMIGSNNANTIFAGAIQDGGAGGGVGGSLTKTGTGTLTLAFVDGAFSGSGASTYTGPTTVNGGKLIVNGSITSPVTVNAGGTLSGSGTTGSVTNNGGVVAPGDPVTLHVNGDYQQSAAGLLRIVIDGPSSFDKLALTGNASLFGALELDFTNGFAPTTGEQFDFLTFGGTQTGSFSQVNIVGLEPGFQFNVGTDGTGNFGLAALNDGVSTPVPEPGALGLLGIGMAGMLLRRRRAPNP